MEQIKQKIKRNATITAVALFALTAAIAIVLAFFGLPSLASLSLVPGDRLAVNTAVSLVQLALLAILFVYVALTLLRIGREQTPFFKELPRKIKTIAVLLLAVVLLPQWLGYAMLSFVTGQPHFTVFNETGIIALVAAGIIFCLGQIFEYGYLIQDESFEII